MGGHVKGIDNRKQPRYVGEHFIQADALRPPVRLADFDLVWASPPCQAFTPLNRMWNAKPNPNLIAETRAMLRSAGSLYVIENVRGARLKATLMLCGSMFGLGWDDAGLRRHRYFEMNFPAFSPPCQHDEERVIGVYGGHGRDRRRKVNTQDFPVVARAKAMGIAWMRGSELSEAIPPHYSQHIGEYAMMALTSPRG